MQKDKFFGCETVSNGFWGIRNFALKSARQCKTMHYGAYVSLPKNKCFFVFNLSFWMWELPLKTLLSYIFYFVIHKGVGLYVESQVAKWHLSSLWQKLFFWESYPMKRVVVFDLGLCLEGRHLTCGLISVVGKRFW